MMIEIRVHDRVLIRKEDGYLRVFFLPRAGSAMMAQSFKTKLPKTSAEYQRPWDEAVEAVISALALCPDYMDSPSLRKLVAERSVTFLLSIALEEKA